MGMTEEGAGMTSSEARLHWASIKDHGNYRIEARITEKRSLYFIIIF
jgi:hypothetical protein